MEIHAGYVPITVTFNPEQVPAKAPVWSWALSKKDDPHGKNPDTVRLYSPLF